MNIKSLFRKPEKFTNYDPNSPASKAARKWDEREGQIVEQNQNLRKITVGLTIAVVALSGGIVWRSLAATMIPYVVTLDAKTGEVRGLGTAQEMRDFQPTEQMNQYFVKQFITDVRGVPLDPVVYKANLTRAQAYLTVDGASLLASKMQDEKLTERFGKSTVQIQINSIVPMEGGKSYQVRWTEAEYSINGQKTNNTTYTGIFTVEHIATKDEQQLAKNPVGLYISNFSWSRDVEAPKNSKQNEQANTASTVANAVQQALP